MRNVLPAVILILGVIASPVWADPTHKEVKDKAEKVKLNTERAHTATHEGKKVTFIPADLHHVKTVKDLEKGHVIGQLHSELAGDETKLAPGKHHVFLKKEGDKWMAYAASHDGEKVVQAMRVEVKKTPKPKKGELAKPHFHAKGWAYCVEYDVFYEDGSEEITIVCTYW